jgi:hypothetical protein
MSSKVQSNDNASASRGTVSRTMLSATANSLKSIELYLIQLHIIRPFTQYGRNDYVAVEQWSRNIIRDRYVFLVALHEQHEHFATGRNGGILQEHVIVST